MEFRDPCHGIEGVLLPSTRGLNDAFVATQYTVPGKLADTDNKHGDQKPHTHTHTQIAYMMFAYLQVAALSIFLFVQELGGNKARASSPV